ncbi:enolase-like domain-containing protein [Fodinicola feengrottensis]|uniref:hypothetical protein n=1 Tax=Fodinicola feengrottensis TaxID=435914 RepID=UPI0013D0FE77|nr:hypothetical protein [Fodinicola feengrottensis]
MKITGVTPFLLRGDEKYGTEGAEATDQGDHLLLVRVDTDEGISGWSDVETLGPVAVRVLSGRGMGALGFRTIAEELVGKDPLRPDLVWDELYVATAYYGRRGVAMHCMSAVDTTASGRSGRRPRALTSPPRSAAGGATDCRLTLRHFSGPIRKETPRPSVDMSSSVSGR